MAAPIPDTKSLETKNYERATAAQIIAETKLPAFGKVGSAVGLIRLQDVLQGSAEHGFAGIYERVTSEDDTGKQSRSRLSASETLRVDAIRMTEFGFVCMRTGKVDIHIPWHRVNYSTPPKEA